MRSLIFGTAFLGIISIQSIAQDLSSRHLGKPALTLQAGSNAYHLFGRNGIGMKTDTKFTITLHAGIMADIPLSEKFAFQSGLVIQQKGGRKPDTVLGTSPSYRIDLFYCDIPFSLVYKTVSGDDILLLGGGPYLGIGIAGKVKRKQEGNVYETDVVFKSKVRSTDPKDKVYFKRQDLGLQAFMGYRFQGRFSVIVQAQMGFGNGSPQYEGIDGANPVTNYLGYGLSLGYCLSK